MNQKNVLYGAIFQLAFQQLQVVPRLLSPITLTAHNGVCWPPVLLFFRRCLRFAQGIINEGFGQRGAFASIQEV